MTFPINFDKSSNSPVIFDPVKKWISFLLAFYILLSTVVPCSLLDNCDEECTETAQHESTGQDNDCTSCSPFAVCSVTPVVITEQSANCSFVDHPYSAIPHFEYDSTPSCGFYSGHFQPPRKS
jgi:hypothetical protein